MIRSTLLLVLMLAGCSTYAERMSEAPAYTGHTDKTPEAFLSCAMPVALEVYHTARIVPAGEAQSIVATQELTGNTLLALTAYPDGRVEWRSVVPNGLGMQDKWRRVQACL